MCSSSSYTPSPNATHTHTPCLFCWVFVDQDRMPFHRYKHCNSRTAIIIHQCMHTMRLTSPSFIYYCRLQSGGSHQARHTPSSYAINMGKEVRIGGDKHSLNSSQSPASSCDGDGNGDIINGGAIGCHIDEIPIWVHGEQRWISGITKETTCAQLVDALLRDQGLKAAKENGSCSSGGSSNAVTTDHMGNQYVITERWKRVEQVLDQRTRILKIWEAWGETKPEVCAYIFHPFIWPGRIRVMWLHHDCIYDVLHTLI